MDFMGQTILIVDDDMDNSDAVRMIFEFHGLNVQTAASGEECLALLAESIPDVILMDVQMPKMTGYQLIAILRANPAYAHLPVIAISAHAMQGDSELGLAAGFDHYITKPYAVNKLLDIVFAILQKTP